MRELLILCFAYAISLFYRGMISVIAPEISADLSLNESGLGLNPHGETTFYAMGYIAGTCFDPDTFAVQTLGAHVSNLACR